MSKKAIPQDRFRDVTYGKFVCNARPHKSEPNRTRLTVGGKKKNYPDDCGTPTADMLVVKLLLNSIMSTKGAKFITADIKTFTLTGFRVRARICAQIKTSLIASLLSCAISRISRSVALFWKGECLGFNAKSNLCREAQVDIECRSFEV